MPQGRSLSELVDGDVIRGKASLKDPRGRVAHGLLRESFVCEVYALRANLLANIEMRPPSMIYPMTTCTIRHA